MTVSHTVDPWDPGYGVAFSEELDGGALEESSAELDLDLETPRAQWRPVDPDPATVLPGMVLFADGVRCIDARVWVHGTRPQPVPGIAYLPPEQAAVVSALRPGQRTPAFTMGTSWRRTSWYLQLSRTSGVPWSGVVRLECSADLPLAEVTRLADLTARVLPPLASVPHKDPARSTEPDADRRLERELRHRLGDQHILYRALRAAAMPAG
jgi:hypothetical protein